MDWNYNDVRHFLAVARTGSTLAASKVLRVNQTTCARRIAELENDLGLVLFERSVSGYSLTEGGSALVGNAEAVEAAAEQMLMSAREQTRAERGEIRFSTSDVLAELFAGPAIASFARLHPNIGVVFNAESRFVDLSQNEADVALRAHPVMDDPQLVVRKVMETPWAFYCAASWAANNGVLPRNTLEVGDFPLASLEGRPESILRAAVPDAKIRYVSNSMKALIDVIKTGEAMGALPMLFGEPHPDLQRCFVVDIDAGGLWIVFHERLRHKPHVRAFVDHLASFIAQWKQDRLPA